MAAASPGLEPEAPGCKPIPVAPVQANQAAAPLLDWRALFEAAAAVQQVSITAETFVRAWPSASKPVAVKCTDGNTYVIKGSNAGRQAVNDCIVAKLAALVVAPVPPSALIAVPEELRLATPEMSHLTPGVAHGSRVMEDCNEREAFSHCDAGDNRQRFASIAILYGWLGANDRQFIYGKNAPYRVYSVDHGHFFGPGNPDWTIAHLAAAPAAAPDHDTVAACAITNEQLSAACGNLHDVTAEQIATAVGSVPRGWPVSVDEQVALCAYLEKRRVELITAFPKANKGPGEKQ
jgi:hypothetical protein